MYNLRESKWSKKCRQDEEGGISEAQKTTFVSDFSIPEFVLEQSMSKYHRETMSRLQISVIVQEITNTLSEIIQKMLHQNIYNQMNTIISEILSIREQLNSFTKENAAGQQKINQGFRVEIKKMRLKIDQMGAKSNSLSFNSIFQQQQKKIQSNKHIKQIDNVEQVLKDVYDFMKKNDANKLFRECEQKIQQLHEDLNHSNLEILFKIQEIKSKQRSLNDSFSKQLSQLSCEQHIEKEVKKKLKGNIRSLMNEIAICRNSIEQIRSQMQKMIDRQREMEFSQLLLDQQIS